MTDRPLSLKKKITRFFKEKLTPSGYASRDHFEEILLEVGRTLSLDELLVTCPRNISSALHLSSFHILLREDSDYVPQGAARDLTSGFIFPASSATILRLKRERRPSPFKKHTPDAWQLLASSHEIAALNALGAQLLIPFEGRTGLRGFATLAKPEGKHFLRHELRFLRELSQQMGRGLETARHVKSLSEEAVNRAKVTRELDLAREVQERLLPQSLPAVPGIDSAATYKSADEVGGDYYDLFITWKGLLCCVVADVSGKGIASALLMATLRASLRSLMINHREDPVTAVIEDLNRLLYEASAASRYATLVFFVYDPTAQTLTYVNAGHNPPLLLNDSEVTRLECGGPVLGLLPDATYEEQTLAFNPGDTLTIYTDGITEAINSRGVEWEEQGLLAAVLEQNSPSAAAAVQDILFSLHSFASGTPQVDDMTLLVLRRT
ncbi:PP2C family protein-serine/threonine phosphatase [Tunturibacter psychrotolerans]|uniref:PP2C family protein-serine/threonine phosphatase n=1 Tax=Tunturiibacter psychrotolerans TaxID=3069686 RepID=A0AAU7ZMM8_9BACT